MNFKCSLASMSSCGISFARPATMFASTFRLGATGTLIRFGACAKTRGSPATCLRRCSNSMKIILLGTSSAVPTLSRGLSSTALVREGDVFLFDCGEGTQLQLMRSTVKRSRIHSIFIGHLHGDHLYGIAGLISTLHLDGREEPLNVFGPDGL